MKYFFTKWAGSLPKLCALHRTGAQNVGNPSLEPQKGFFYTFYMIGKNEPGRCRGVRAAAQEKEKREKSFATETLLRPLHKLWGLRLFAVGVCTRSVRNKSKKEMAYTMLDVSGMNAATTAQIIEKLNAVPQVIRVRIL